MKLTERAWTLIGALVLIAAAVAPTLERLL